MKLRPDVSTGGPDQPTGPFWLLFTGCRGRCPLNMAADGALKQQICYSFIYIILFISYSFPTRVTTRSQPTTLAQKLVGNEPRLTVLH